MQRSFILNEQCFEILQSLIDSGQSAIVEQVQFAGRSFAIVGTKENLDLREPQFVYDDLDVMVEEGLLLKQYDDEGRAAYVVTRQAARWVRMMMKRQLDKAGG